MITVGAQPVLEEAIAKFHECGESASLMLSTLGGGAWWVGNYDDAERRYREALAEARAAEDAYAIAVAMGGLGQCLVSLGKCDEARSQLVEARERFEELNVNPGVADADLFLALVEREVGSYAESARRLHMALNAPGETWYDEADYWVAQTTASIIDDHSTAAMLIGAAAARYERSNVPQSVSIARELEQTTHTLQRVLGPEEFGRCHRAGGRRTRTEILQATNEALESFIARVGGPDSGGDPAHDI